MITKIYALKVSEQAICKFGEIQGKYQSFSEY